MRQIKDLVRGKNDRISKLKNRKTIEAKYAYLQSVFFNFIIFIIFVGADGVKGDEKLKLWLLTPIFERIVNLLFFLMKIF